MRHIVPLWLGQIGLVLIWLPPMQWLIEWLRLDKQFQLPHNQMQMQLEDYFQQELPKHKLINQKISPILNRVRTKQINSIHQLGGELHSIKSEPIQRSQHRTGKLIFSTRDVQNRIKSPQIGTANATSRKGKSSTIDWSTKTSFRSTPWHSPETPYATLSPSSKIKKHLIQHIDFDQLKKAMYHQDEKVTIFEDFCYKIKEKRRNGKSDGLSSLRFKRKDPTEIDFDPEATEQVFEPSERIFRVSQRRRFWKGGVRGPQSKWHQMQCLQIRGLSSTVS